MVIKRNREEGEPVQRREASPLREKSKVFLRCENHSYIGIIHKVTDTEILLKNAGEVTYEDISRTWYGINSVKEFPFMLSVSRAKVCDATYFDGPLQGEEQK